MASTCHMCFIPSNLISPPYWEHLFAPRPRMEVLEGEFIFLDPLLISSLRRRARAAARRGDGTAPSRATARLTAPQRRRGAS